MKIKTLLDSGAYGAFTSKKHERIELTQYIAFIKSFGCFFDLYVNLDVIAGSRGDYEFDPELIEIAAKQSDENLRRMKDADLNPIPVFHQGENFSWLRRFRDDGEAVYRLVTLQEAKSSGHDDLARSMLRHAHREWTAAGQDAWPRRDLPPYVSSISLGHSRQYEMVLGRSVRAGYHSDLRRRWASGLHGATRCHFDNRWIAPRQSPL